MIITSNCHTQLMIDVKFVCGPMIALRFFDHTLLKEIVSKMQE